MTTNTTAIITEEPSEANIVEACSWDLTMGAANHMIGKLFLRTTSSSSHDTPDAIDHVGIIVFNRLYEYGNNGIKKSNIPRNGDEPMPQYPGCKLRAREYLGKTPKTRGEFIEWMVNVKYGEYRGANYDLIHHNCLDFAKSACIFLQVPPNPNWEKISNWAKNNKKIAGLFTRNGQVAGNYTSSPDSAGVSPSTSESSSSIFGRRNSRSLQQTGRSMTIPEESDQLDQSSDCNNDNTPEYSTVVGDSPRRRRLSVNPPRSYSRFSFRSRSASMETLPPTYEEAINMSLQRRESMQSAAPSYESCLTKAQTANDK